MFIRWRQFRTYRADDLFNCLALLCLFGDLAVNEFEGDPDTAAYWRIILAVNLLFWATFFCAKACFLALIWSIFNVSSGFRKAWWAVSIYTFVTFWPIMLSEFWQCGDPADYDNPVACQLSGPGIDVLCMRFTLHLSSACFILVLPIAQIRKLNISLIRKLTVGAIFAIVIIDIITGIIRNITTILYFSNVGDQTIISPMDTICGVIEPILAVAVCALPAYRSVLPWPRKRSSDQFELHRNPAEMGEHAPRNFLSVAIPTSELQSQATKEEMSVV